MISCQKERIHRSGFLSSLRFCYLKCLLVICDRFLGCMYTSEKRTHFLRVLQRPPQRFHLRTSCHSCTSSQSSMVFSFFSLLFQSTCLLSSLFVPSFSLFLLPSCVLSLTGSRHDCPVRLRTEAHKPLALCF